MVQLRDQIKSEDPQLSQNFDEVLASKQESMSDDKLTQEEPDDRVDDTSKLTLRDNERKDITSQSKI